MNADNGEIVNCNQEMNADSWEIATYNEEKPDYRKEMKISIGELSIDN